ncbi:thioredoxin related protein [Psychroflexus gondwanensis ACAM 44]|uniref:Thioredoxin related protein n=1 Tax=Psychroflexus gondwanensis ACAM 44 TaxID=1189619 RepID=N1WIP2_9FLAO|nr:thioredoxin family protein [Psychroflexus gondwanensis]EMY80121.1 thioredoxin related protein [Psychroflexus gondwanensis ACAM 44]
MKYWSTAIMLLFITSLSAQVEWMSMNEALRAQKDEPKKIFADFYTDWCGPCKAMDKNTFAHPDVAEYINTHYYPVKFNAEGTEKVFYKDFEYTNPNFKPNRKGKRNAQHFFANALKVSAYPTVVFFDEEANVISPVVGYKTPQQLELYLKMIATGAYKELTTQGAWEDYQSKFESTFKE